MHEPGSPWDEDGDGWIGPYVDEGVPEGVRASLAPGASVVVRGAQLELSLAPPSNLLLAGIAACLLFGVWSIVAPIVERRAVAAAKSDPISALRAE